jgi:hypothetical protein
MFGAIEETDDEAPELAGTGELLLQASDVSLMVGFGGHTVMKRNGSLLRQPPT